MPAASLNYLTVVHVWGMDCLSEQEDGFVLRVVLALLIAKMFLI